MFLRVFLKLKVISNGSQTLEGLTTQKCIHNYEYSSIVAPIMLPLRWFLMPSKMLYYGDTKMLYYDYPKYPESFKTLDANKKHVRQSYKAILLCYCLF